MSTTITTDEITPSATLASGYVHRGLIRNRSTGLYLDPVAGTFTISTPTLTSAGIAYDSEETVNSEGSKYTYTIPSACPAGGDYELEDRLAVAGVILSTGYLEWTSDPFSWDGSDVATASTVNLSAYALTTLASLKRHLRITVGTYDTLLTECINAATAKIETVTARRFMDRTYRERVNGNFNRRLTLRRYPINKINHVAFGVAEAMTVTYSGSAIRATVGVFYDQAGFLDGGVRLMTINTSGGRTVTDLPATTYASCSTLAAAINAISGWTAAVGINVPTSDLIPTGSQNAHGYTVFLCYPDQDRYEYTADYEKGLIEFTNRINDRWENAEDENPFAPSRFPQQFQGITIEYNAGYTSIPADLQLLCNDLAKEAYLLGPQNTGVKGSSLGPYSVTFRDDADERIRQRCADYKDLSQAAIGGSA